MKTRHLLINIPVITFTTRLLSSNKIAAGRIFLSAIYFVNLIAVMPVEFLQFLCYHRKINRTIINKQPVFILGHYRSGTTYLHKLLAADPRFGSITSYDIVCPNSSLLFGRWLKNILQFIINFFRIQTSLFNNKILDLNEPAEEERFLINKGSAFTDYWRFVFPKCWNKWQTCAELSRDINYYKRWKTEYMYLLKLASFKNKGKQLVLKSPPNTGRIEYLLEMFPNAKFIYISRNPYHVFYSTCNLWRKAIKKFWLQNLSADQIEEIVFDEYISLLKQYEEGKKRIPEKNLIEIKYEELEAEPVNILKKVYEELNLGDFETFRSTLIHEVQKENLYKKFEYSYNKKVLEKIEERWALYINKWNCMSRALSTNNYKQAGIEINTHQMSMVHHPLQHNS